MHPIKSAGAAMLLASVSLGAQAAVSEQEVADLKQQVQALLARVEQLEARNQELSAGAAPAAKIEALEVRVADIEATNEAQTDRLAQAAAFDRAADWAGKLKWKGDFRYRHEMIDQEGSAERNRQRVRGRLGLDAKVYDTITAGFLLATGDGLDPRSTNQTLGDSNLRDSIQVDQVYVAWNAFTNATLVAGKQAQPWFRPGGSLVYDSDVNPEGVALRWGDKTGPFANAWGFWLSEVSAGADANLVGAQFGWRTSAGLTVAASYHDYGAIQRSTLAFTDFPAGNSTYNGNSSCNLPAPTTGAIRCYVYDYDILGLSVEYATQVGALPLQLWAGYVENQDPSDLNTGYDVGFRLGRASDPGTWEIALLYQDVEKDAQWAGFIDSDFAGGSTQGKGLQFRGGWTPVRNVALNLTYFDNQRNYDTSSEVDYQRLQLDFNFRF
jgi:hypothetical protein